MVKKQPVSMHWQTVFVIFFPTWIYAFYRIEKLRRSLAIIFPIFVGGGLTIEWLLFPDDFLADDPSDEFQLFELVLILLEIGFSMILVRKWTREWNDQFLFHSSAGQN